MELKQELGPVAPLLASLERTNPFRVPAGYFEDNLRMIPQMMMEEELETETMLNKLPPSRNPFVVPDEYFERFPLQMTALAQAGASSYQVPEGYFEHFPEHMLQLVREHNAEEAQPGVRVLPLSFQRLELRRWMSAVAVAASLLLMLTLIRQAPPGSHPGRSVSAADYLAQVSPEEIDAFVNEGNLSNDDLTLLADNVTLPSSFFQDISLPAAAEPVPAPAQMGSQAPPDNNAEEEDALLDLSYMDN